VGQRAATRIIVELKGKVEAVPATVPASPRIDATTDAVAALVALGYSASEAKRAVDTVQPGDSVEETLRGALTVLSDNS